jgi:hypothetical protein
LHVTPKENAFYAETVAHHDKMYFTTLVDVRKKYTLYTGSYKDKRLLVQEGLFEYYTKNIETMRGNYHNGRQVGTWQKWNTDSLLIDSVGFNDDGEVLAEAKYNYHANRKLWRYEIVNTDGQRLTRQYDTVGNLESEGKFTDNDGETFIYYPSGKSKMHSVFKGNTRTFFEFFDESGKKYNEQEYAEFIKAKQ